MICSEVSHAEIDDKDQEHLENMNKEEPLQTGVLSQTDLTIEELSIKFGQLTFTSKKLADLESKLENSPFGLMDEKSNNDKWKYYTGFIYEIINSVIFPLVEKYTLSTSTTVSNSFTQLLLTLVKL